MKMISLLCLLILKVKESKLGGECFYDLKAEVYDHPEHQKVVLWENKSTIHIHVIYLEKKLGHDIVQAIACLKGYKASETKLVNFTVCT